MVRRKRLFLLGLILSVFLISVPVLGEFGFDTFTFSGFKLKTLPAGIFTSNFFENYMPEATFLIEENNGFAMLDAPKVYFDGDSYVHFNWSLDGFDIRSRLEDGAPALIVPFSAVEAYRLNSDSPRGFDSGFDVILKDDDENARMLHVSSIASDVGGYTFLGEILNSGHPSGRADMLSSERRQFLSNYFIDGGLRLRFSGSSLSVYLTHFDAGRQFNDFNIRDSVFEEDGSYTTVLSRFKVGAITVIGAYHRLERDRLFAEIGRLPQETYHKKKTTWFGGAHFEKNGWDACVSLMREGMDLRPNAMNFAKDLMDNDGEGFFPFEKWGDFSATTLNAEVERKTTDRFLKKPVENRFRFNLSSTFHSGYEEAFDHNAISFDGQPYQVVLWEGGDSYNNQNHTIEAGMRSRMDLSYGTAIHTKLWVLYQHLRFDFSDNNLHRLAPAFDVGIHLFRNRKAPLLISLGRRPYDLRQNVNGFLEHGGPSGTVHDWCDGDLSADFQTGEEGDVVGYTGGRTHFVDDLKLLIKERVMASLSYKFSKRFRFNVKCLVARVRNNLWVDFQEEYGFYERRDERDLYFFDRPFENYVLTNDSHNKDPFYGKFLLHVEGKEKERWYFSLSFMAHIGMGTTVFGNGPGANDIGLIGESMANPNSRIHGFGRLDGDRAFVAKLYFGTYLFKGLFLSANWKYRDGNPYAYFTMHEGYGQRVITYTTIKAEDSRGIKGGPREDFVADMSVRLSYSFNVFGGEAIVYLSALNVWDLGSELSEYVFVEGDWHYARYAAELQVPRSLRFGFQMSL